MKPFIGQQVHYYHRGLPDNESAFSQGVVAHDRWQGPFAATISHVTTQGQHYIVNLQVVEAMGNSFPMVRILFLEENNHQVANDLSQDRYCCLISTGAEAKTIVE